MKRNTLFSILATAAFGIVMANPINAADSTWDGSKSTDWDDADNWSNGVPGSGDTATIPNETNDPLIDSSVTVGTLIINTGAVVTVQGAFAPVTLTLDGNTQTFNGDLVLSNSTARVEFTYAQSSGWIAIDGSAGIKGEHASAEVRLNDAKIDSDTVFRGQMVIKEVAGTSTFKNGSTGIVRANANGTLLFVAGLALDDDCGAKWESIEASGNSTLEFGSTVVFVDSNPELRGDFVLSDCATMEFNGTTFKTAGSFSSPVGNISNSGGTFSYLDAGTCASPTSYTDIDNDQCFGGAPCCP